MSQINKNYIFTIISIAVLSYLFLHTFPRPYTVTYNTIIIKEKTPILSSGQLFFKAYNEEYTEKKSRFIHSKYLYDNHQILFYSPHTVKTLRVDPLSDQGIIIINNLTISYKNIDSLLNLNNIYNLHDLRIIDKNSTSLTLEATGKDPHFEINALLNYNKILSLDIIYSILAGIVGLILFTLNMTHKHNILMTFLIIYTLFVLSGLYWGVAIFISYIFALCSLVCFIIPNYKQKVSIIKPLFVLFMIYALLSYLSIYTTTHLANIDYLNSKLPLILSVLIILTSFYNISQFNVSFFRKTLTLLLIAFAITIILLNNEVLVLDYYIETFNITIGRNPATQKNYMFWYVILFFGTLAFYNPKKVKDLVILITIVLLSFYALFHGYSHSARLAFVSGLTIYIIFTFVPIKKKIIYILIWLMTFYIILSPLIFSLIDLTPYHHRLISRDAIYHTSAALIKEHWLFGYGYGATLNIDIRDFVTPSNFPTHYINSFRGGHPHNLALLFWLEFGIFGAIFLAYYIHKLLLYIVNASYGHTNFAALCSLFVSFDIITSFSWSVWYPQVLLTYAFFGSILLLLLNISQNKKRG